MRCPRCRCTKLKLGIVFAGEVACTFRDDEIVEVLETGSLDSYWSEDSACQCIECGWSGRVAELRRSARPVRGGSDPAVDRSRHLTEIERQVEEGNCPKSIRGDVQQMMRMIRQLQKQVQILETVTRAGRRQQLVSGSDTAIF
jgi:hypothetical protein